MRRVIVVVNIRRIVKLAFEQIPFLNCTDIRDVIRYILSKERGYDLGDWDHRAVSQLIPMIVQGIREENGLHLDIPSGVITIEKIEVRKETAYISCTGAGGVFSSGRTDRSEETHLRSRVHRETKESRYTELVDGLVKGTRVNRAVIQRILQA